MNKATDYYQTLQVHPKAETEVIQAAYRKLAAKYHPDVNKAPDSAERMKQINIAYGVLSDPHQRAEYDTYNKLRPPTPRVNKTRNNSSAWKNLVFIGLILLFVFVVPRFGATFMFSVARFGVPLLVTGLVIWLVYTFSKPKQ